MKDIKFRAWDTVDKKMKLPTLLRLNRDLPYTDDNNNGKVFQMQCNGQENIEYFNGRIVLMQCIGLSDKNGKEIYEGDILYNDREKSTYEVIWIKEECRFGLRYKFKRSYEGKEWVETREDIPLNRMPYSVLVGNIYQNSELLEVK
jgi:uncharacterized phage protein (TIGR01671 family)